VLVTGGRAWSRTLAAAGRRAGNALAGVRAGVAVPGASGACGLTTPDQAGAAARRAMIRPAGRRAAAAGRGRPGDGLVPELGSGGLRVAQA